MSQIVTGDAVVLDLRPARVPTRLLAILIDLAVVFALGWIWNKVSDAVATDSSTQTLLSLVGYIVITLGYFIGLETLTRGRTLGKWALGLRVVRDDGGTIGFRQALIRGLAFWLVDFAAATAMLGGLLAATLNPSGKRIGDMLAGTLVVRVRAPRLPTLVPLADLALADWGSTLELSRVTDEHIAAARYALQRAPLLRPAYRRALMQSLAFEMARVTSPDPPAGVDPEAYLTTVLGEIRRRSAEKRARSLGIEIPAGWR